MNNTQCHCMATTTPKSMTAHVCLAFRHIGSYVACTCWCIVTMYVAIMWLPVHKKPALLQ